MLDYLTAHVLPKGVCVVVVQKVPWLTACIECDHGSVTIADSTTDYVVLLESGYDKLKAVQHNGPVTTDLLRMMLPYMLALFEAKTTSSLASREGPIRQATAEYLAVNKLRGGTSGETQTLHGCYR